MKILPVALALSTLGPTAALSITGLALARPAPAAAPSAPRSLSVQGEATVNVVPDLARMTFQVDASASDRAKAMADADAKLAKLVEAARGAGVDASDIQTSQVSLTPEYARDRHGNPLYLQVKSWTATRTVTVCHRKLERMGALLAAVVDAGGIPVGDVVYDTSRLTELREEARKLAAQAARRKGKVLVEELGGSLGAPRTIVEDNNHWSGPYATKNASANDLAGAFVDGAFAPGKMTITANVRVDFDIES